MLEYVMILLFALIFIGVVFWLYRGQEKIRARVWDLEKFVSLVSKKPASPDTAGTTLAHALGVRLKLDRNRVLLLQSLPMDNIVAIAATFSEDDVVGAHQEMKDQDPAADETER